MPNKTTNPLVTRMREDNVFMGGTQNNLRAAMDSTYANLRGGNGPQTDFGQQNALNNAGIYEPGSFGAQNAEANGTGFAAPASQFGPAGNVFGAGMSAGRSASGAPSSLNLATGNIFGGNIPTAERAAAIGSTVPEQVAGVISGLPDQNKVNTFQRRLMDAGINSENMAANASTVQAIYNNVFSSGMPAGAPSSSSGLPSGTPVTAFAPTGLRDRAIAAGGNGVFGTGDVAASFDGMNAQGGRKFSLGQATFPGQSPAAPQIASPAKPASPDAYTTNAASFKDHLVTQQMQAGLMKALPPGYMLDPTNRGRIMPIPGGPAEQKVADDAQKRTEDAQAKTEKVRQVAEVAGNVVSNIDSILPKIDSLTAGPVGGVAQHVPGTAGFNVGAILKGVKANLGVQQLQSMRDASKTGASGFGQLSEKELDVVTSTVANLDQAQDPEQLKAGLAKVRDHFNAWKLSYEAGQKAANGTLSPQEQAKTLLAIRAAAKNK